MIRWSLRSLLLLGAIGLIACGAGAPESGVARQPATLAPAEETVAAEVVTATPDATAETATAGKASVTPIMEQLQLAGEPYAAVGDPSAPLTVIEFSDYG